MKLSEGIYEREIYLHAALASGYGEGGIHRKLDEVPLGPMLALVPTSNTKSFGIRNNYCFDLINGGAKHFSELRADFRSGGHMDAGNLRSKFKNCRRIPIRRSNGTYHPHLLLILVTLTILIIHPFPHIVGSSASCMGGYCTEGN